MSFFVKHKDRRSESRNLWGMIFTFISSFRGSEIWNSYIHNVKVCFLSSKAILATMVLSSR